MNRFGLVALLLVTALLTVGLADVAHADSLIGADVKLDWYFPDMTTFFGSSGTETVGAGVEYPSGFGGFSPVSVDITAGQVIVDTGGADWAGAPFNGFLLSVVAGPDITSASYSGGSMNVTSLSVTDAGLWVNFAGQTGGRAVIDLTASSAVPEPGTLALLGLGLAGLGFAGRRRKVRAS